MIGLFKKPQAVSAPSTPVDVKGLVQSNLAAPETSASKRVHYEAGSESPNLYEVEYTGGNLASEATRYQRLTWWLNERGLLRIQQSLFTKWDVPLRIFGPGDQGGFGSDIIQVLKFRKSSSPQDAPQVFAVRANGRVATSIYEEQFLTFPNGKFADGTAQTGGPWGSPSVRLETDDRVWMGGRIGVSGATLAVGEVIGRTPIKPTKDRMVMIGNSTGGVCHCIIQASTGDIINQRAAASGAGAIFLDDVSYRV